MAALSVTRKCLVRSPALSFPVFQRGNSTQVNAKSNIPFKPKKDFGNKTHIGAGRIRASKRQNLPITYEEAKPPHLIGVEKAWSSWNTSNLKDEGRRSESLVEDVFIRQFMDGTWYQMLGSDIVIKRRHNMVVISAIIRGQHFKLQFIYFLQGYTEELLAHYLKCPVKLELQSIKSEMDTHFKYI